MSEWADMLQATAKNGNAVLTRISAPIRWGANVVTSVLTQAGSNEFRLAMLPVPKKANIVRNIYNNKVKE
jgi:hypothetical protein